MYNGLQVLPNLSCQMGRFVSFKLYLLLGATPRQGLTLLTTITVPAHRTRILRL